jgi:predicted DNA-binding transcriptional regulator AlpA
MPATNQATRLIDVSALAAWLGVTEKWVYRQTARGATHPLPAVKVGGFLRFDPAEIEEWIKAHRIDHSDEWTPAF